MAQSGPAFRCQRDSQVIRATSERVGEGSLRRELKISEQQYSFMPGKSATDAVFDSADGEVLRRSECVAMCLYGSSKIT